MRRAFSLIELLVAMAVIGVLVALLLPALSSAQRSSKKRAESSAIRALHTAFEQYATRSQEACLPGHLDSAVVNRWDLENFWPGGAPMLPNDLGYWATRLLPSLGNQLQPLLHGYGVEDPLPLRCGQADGNDPLDPWDASGPWPEATLRRTTVSRHPAFAYNGRHIGGRWIETEDGIGPAIRSNNPVLVRRTVSTITRPSHLVLFCSATPSRIQSSDLVRDRDTPRPGVDLIGPPNAVLQTYTYPAWQSIEDVPYKVETLALSPGRQFAEIPWGRHTGEVVVLAADGHVETESVPDLDDMTRWVDGLTDPEWAPTSD